MMKWFISFLSLLILMSFPVFAVADTSTNNRIYNTGEIVDITENFVDVSQSNSTNAYGGAISNYGESSLIQAITGDFINNYVLSEALAYGGAIYNTGTIYEITAYDNGFRGNYAISNTDEAYGGAIYNANTIGEITGDFSDNYVSGNFAYGGAIYNNKYSSIDTITGNFTDNYAIGLSAYGGAIFGMDGVMIDSISGDFTGNYAMSRSGGTGGGAIVNHQNCKINSISGDFSNNYVSGYTAYGGAILQILGEIGSIEGNFSYNYAQANSMFALGGAILNYISTIDSITGDFNNNYTQSNSSYALGGAILNADGGKINTITGNFSNNYVSGPIAYGGAIYNTGTISSISGSFTDNYAIGTSGNTYGGAIYTTNSLTICADNTTDLFSGNYVSTDGGVTKTYQAIYIDNKDATLTLEATNGGVIEFDDIIDGVLGYNVVVTGSSSENNPGVVRLFNNINNANVATDNIVIDLIDETINNYTFNSLTSQASSLWEIDVNLLEKSADTITLTNPSTGTITINNLNFLDLITSEEPVVIRIIYSTDSDVQLALGENIHFTNDIYNELPDEVHSSEQYCLENGISITTTETTNDSLEIHPDEIYDTLAIINQKESENRSFIFDKETNIYTAAEDIGETASGTLNVIGIAGDNSTIDFNSHNAFTILDDAILNLSDVIITGASGETGSVLDVSEGGTVNITDSTITSNKTEGIAIISNKGTINIEANNSNVKFYNNSSSGTSSSAIYNTGTINMTTGGADIILNDTITGEISTDTEGNSTPVGTINITGSSSDSTSGSVYIENEISSNTVNLDSGSIYFTSAADEDGNVISSGTLSDNVNFNFYSGEVSLVNDSINSANLGNLTLYDDMSLSLDADLETKVMDTITASGFESNGYSINISSINITEPTTETTITISPLGNIEDEVLKSSIAEAINYTGEDVIYSPIYKYSVSYDPDTALLTFGLYENSGSYSSYNPSVFAAPVAAQLGGYLTQLNSYDEAFKNMDMYMLLTFQQRQALKFRNKYAYSGSDTFKVYQSANNSMENDALWTRPYSTFENVRLRGGTKVSNVAYGSFFGGESKMYDLGHGWDGVLGAYIGYNGSHQAYQSIDIFQNGGTFGVVGMAYKDNFFSGLTLNVSANAAEAGTMYGNDNFAMLMSGAAWKSGYNFELAKGKFVIQPNYLMSYTFVNTFDFTDAAGVRVKSNPLNAIQIEPGIKFIANLRNSWQPYLDVSMVWNIIDSTKFKANDVSLPELSVRPFVKYGVGLRKICSEKFAGYFQTYITNGGRNGVGLQFGFHWMF